MNITIRKAGKADAAVIAEFNALMAEETEHRSLDRDVLRKGVDALFQDASRGLYYIAEADGKIVGQTMVTYEWSDWRNGTFWWIQSVYVRKEYRGRGVFTSLFEHIRNLANERMGVCGLRLYVETENERAKKTYSNLGMSKTTYEMFEIDFALPKEAS